MVHVLLPFVRWYDDLVYTWVTKLLFRPEGTVDVRCWVRDVERGAELPLEQVWWRVQRWHTDRLDEGFHDHSIADAEAIYRQAGLLGSFWEWGESG